MNKRIAYFILAILTLIPVSATAQKDVEVHGTSVYEVGENDNITLREAKRKCLELAKAEAIKAEFGELITSDVIDTNAETNGETTTSFFWENTIAMAKGDWLGDTQEPQLDIEYKDGKLVFTAEVWGRAREIMQSKADLKWKILREENGEKEETNRFRDKDKIYISFRSPADGYVAVYLIQADDDTSCLLPYKNDSDGRFQIKRGKEYVFFDRESDPANYPYPYKLTTKHAMEDNQLVIIYSPNPFTKCNDVSNDPKRPNTLNTHDFQKWLLKCQRSDSDMIVNKKWVKIRK